MIRMIITFGIAIVAVIFAIRIMLFLIPNILILVLWGIIILAGIVATVAAIALLVILAIKWLRKESKEVIKEYAMYFAVVAILATILTLINNHAMPVVADWIAKASSHLI